jgi:hypothetical protein
MGKLFENSSDQNCFTQQQRRRFLKKMLVGGAVLSLPVVSFAEQNYVPFDAVFERFLKLSQQITGNSNLDQQFAKRIFTALSYNPNFKHHLSVFATDSNVDQWNDAEQAMVLQLMRAWYLGLVHKGGEDVVVGYEQALMFNSVKGAVGIRSFCFEGAPGDWSQKPILTNQLMD